MMMIPYCFTRLTTLADHRIESQASHHRDRIIILAIIIGVERQAEVFESGSKGKKSGSVCGSSAWSREQE